MTQVSILIVDDEAEILEILMAMLSDYRVVCALSVAEAKEALARERWDLVITDIRMPGPSGYSLISHVKERSPEMPIIVITGCGRSNNPTEALVSRWVTKPFRRAHVLEVVREVLEEARGATVPIRT